MRHRGFAAIAALWLLSGAALAEPSSVGTQMPGDVPDKVRFAVGGMLVSIFTEGALGSTNAGLGASINFEDSVGLPGSKDVGRGEVNWHINRRQFLDFGFFQLNRTGTNVLAEDVAWGDYIFLANSDVSGHFRSNFAYAAWRYSFLDLPQVRISGSAGIDYMTLDAGLAASAGVTDSNGTPITGSVDKSEGISAPVPLFGLQLDWALTRKLAVVMYLRQIYVNVSGIDGGVSESTARLAWWYAKHAGISGGVDRQSVDLKSYESGDTRVRFRYEVRGFSFYFNFAF